MADRVYTFKQVAEHLQNVVTEHWLKKQRRLGNIEATPFGRGWVLTEKQLRKLVDDGLPTAEQRRRPQPKAKAALRQPKPVRKQMLPEAGATEPLVFDRTRSRRFRAGGAA